jgi:hypothetical protein
MIMKRKLELAILSVCGLFGLVWAMTTHHLPEITFELDYLIDISSLLTVASFSVRAMLPLRVLAVASGIMAIPYFMLQPTPLWTPVGWTALFLVINSYHIVRILLERRPVKFTPDEQRLYDLTFQRFEPREFLKLLKLGEWKTARRDEKVLTSGTEISHIVVPISGEVSATQGGREVATLGPGEVIGAGIALTGQTSTFDAAFAEDARYVSWSVAATREFRAKNPDLAPKFDDILNRYLVAQLNKLAGHISDTGSPSTD